MLEMETGVPAHRRAVVTTTSGTVTLTAEDPIISAVVEERRSGTIIEAEINSSLGPGTVGSNLGSYGWTNVSARVPPPISFTTPPAATELIPNTVLSLSSEFGRSINLDTSEMLRELKRAFSDVNDLALQELRAERALLTMLWIAADDLTLYLKSRGIPDPPKLEAFKDPDAAGPPTLRIVVHPPEGATWEEQMRLWDEASELVSGTLLPRSIASRLVVSIEPP